MMIVRSIRVLILLLCTAALPSTAVAEDCPSGARCGNDPMAGLSMEVFMGSWTADVPSLVTALALSEGESVPSAEELAAAESAGFHAEITLASNGTFELSSNLDGTGTSVETGHWDAEQVMASMFEVAFTFEVDGALEASPRYVADIMQGDAGEMILAFEGVEDSPVTFRPAE